MRPVLILAAGWTFVLLAVLALAALSMVVGRRQAELDLRGVPTEER